MTGTRKPHLLALRAGDRRRDLRAVGAVLAVAVAGYLSLGTSCDPPSVEASATVRFAVGQERKRISVWAQGERLWLEFDAEVTLLRDGETVALTREDGQGSAGSAGLDSPVEPSYWSGDGLPSTSCEVRQGSRSARTVSCSDFDLPNAAVYWELIRSATGDAQEVEVRATVSGDCEGDLPVGIALEVEAEP